MTRPQSSSPTKTPTKTPTFNLQGPALRRRNSLRSFGTSTKPLPRSSERTTLSDSIELSPVTRRVSQRSSSLQHAVPASPISPSQESPRGTKRKAGSPTKKKVLPEGRTLLPPSKPTAPPQPPVSEIPRRRSTRLKSSAQKQPATDAPPAPENPRRRSSTRKSPPRDQHSPTQRLSPEVIRRRSTLRSYNPYPLPPGLNLPKGVVLPIPGQPHQPASNPAPKHICLRGKPPCGQAFPTRVKLHQHQRVQHGGAPLGWLKEETAKVVAKGKRYHEKKDDKGGVVEIWTTGKDTPECHVCGKKCSNAKLLEKHLQTVHGLGVEPEVIVLEDD